MLSGDGEWIGNGPGPELDNARWLLEILIPFLLTKSLFFLSYKLFYGSVISSLISNTNWMIS